MAKMVSKLVAPVFFSNVCFFPSNVAKISPCVTYNSLKSSFFSFSVGSKDTLNSAMLLLLAT